VTSYFHTLFHEVSVVNVKGVVVLRTIGGVGGGWDRMASGGLFSTISLILNF